MKKIAYIVLCLFACVSLSHAEFFAKESADPYEFDLLKDHAQITKVELVVLKGRSIQDVVGGVVTQKTMVVSITQGRVDKIIDWSDRWDADGFRKLFKGFDKTIEYEDCFCMPKYPMGMIFYIDVKLDDPFGEGAGTIEKKKVAAVMFDEAHDSVLLSDMKHGQRYFRFSEGHRVTRRVPQYIKAVFKQAGMEYTFMKRE